MNETILNTALKIFFKDALLAARIRHAIHLLNVKMTLERSDASSGRRKNSGSPFSSRRGESRF
jgi:hypothetical protein